MKKKAASAVDYPVSLRLGELREPLQKLADEDRRPLSAYIRLILEDHVRTKTPRR